MGKTLYIIGNGFDLAHKIESKYCHFYQYLSIYQLSIDEDIFPNLAIGSKPRRADEAQLLLEECDFHLWNEFEEQLSNFEVPCNIKEDVKDSLKMLESHSQGYIDFESAKDFIQHSVNRYIKSINNIKENFCNWITQIDISHVIGNNRKGLRKYKFEDNANFLSFNYTKTLEEGYNIEENKICHIHGKKGDSDLIIGHSWECEKPAEMSTEEQRYYEIQGNNRDLKEEDKEKYIRNEFVINEERLDSYIKRVFRNNIIIQFEKRSTDIMDSNDSFYSVLENVSKIVIIGHSLSKVDMPYFHAIKAKSSKGTIWEVGCFDEEAKKRADEFKNILGISDDKFKKFKSKNEFDLTKINYL